VFETGIFKTAALKFRLLSGNRIASVSKLGSAVFGRLAFALLLVAATFASFNVTSARAESLKLVATTSIVGDVVRSIAADRASVTILMGPGVDPHLYRQTQADIAAMAQADAVFWNGLYLEAQLEEFLKRLEQRTNVIAIAEAVPSEFLIEHPDYPGRYDPHVWMDPQLWRHAVLATRDALILLDPAGEEVFTANAELYLAGLDELAAYADTVLASVADEQRVLISAHDAFSYFGRAYDFEVLGIQGISTESEAGLKHIADLVDVIVERRIGAVFVETSVSDRSIRSLLEGVAARGLSVPIGGELYSDALGAPGSYEGTWIGMIDSNVTTITRALGGTAPASGMNGHLSAS